MTYYERLKRKRLGDILVDEGLVDRDVVIRALQEQQASPRLLSEILLEHESVTPYDLARVIVDNYQVPFLDVSSYSFHKDLVEAIPSELLHEAGVMPLDRFGSQMCFVCQEIPGNALVERLKKHAPGGIYFYVGLANEIRESLHNQAPVASAVLDTEDAEDQVVAPLVGEEPLPEELEVLTDDERAAAALKALREDGEEEEPDEDAERASWTELFDSADASILSELGGDE